MKATIITIGDEILIGQIVDTNSGYIAKYLDNIGIQTIEMLSISDNKEHIISTLKLVQNKVDIVLITGGLGPTKDDITKKTFCDYFDDELIENKEVLAHVTEIIEKYLKRPMTQLNIEQALVPSKCEVLFNKMGTAPGMWIKKENTVYIAMPGVPYEMKYLMENEVIPKLIASFNRPHIVHKTILTYGQGESLIAERIEDWENNLPEFIKLAYLPSPGKVRLRLTARGIDKTILVNSIDVEIKKLEIIIGDIIVGFDESETIEVVVGKKLKNLGKTLSVAESCTGGKIAQMITSVSGASNYFKSSVVSYANETKVQILHVKQETINQFGVVSKEVALEMAHGIKKITHSDFSLATTGNAGPTKGDDKVEVGTVFIALVTPKSEYVEEFSFGQPRDKVIDRAANKALEMLLKEI